MMICIWLHAVYLIPISVIFEVVELSPDEYLDDLFLIKQPNPLSTARTNIEHDSSRQADQGGEFWCGIFFHKWSVDGPEPCKPSLSESGGGDNSGELTRSEKRKHCSREIYCGQEHKI